MKHKVKVTVIDKKLYPDLQKQYCANPESGACPCYNIGDEFIFERDGDKDDFWHMGLNSLKRLPLIPILSQAVLKFRIARRHGTLYPVIFTQDYRAVLL